MPDERAFRLAAVPGPFDTSPRPWDPTTEVFPGGPHPGMVHRLHEEARIREEEEAMRAKRKRRNLILLLR